MKNIPTRPGYYWFWDQRPFTEKKWVVAEIKKNPYCDKLCLFFIDKCDYGEPQENYGLNDIPGVLGSRIEPPAIKPSGRV